ncbi:MAG: ABC transporter permease [bacterium]|nr:ABC transporter permease [bacterium]
MKQVITIAIKDLRLLVRDRFGMFWVLGFPLIYAIFFGAIFRQGDDGGRSAMDIAVVDEDRTSGSASFITHLRDSDALRVHDEFSREEARDQVRRSNLVGFVVVQPGFGSSWGLLTGEAPKLEIGIDPARSAESAYLQGILMKSSFRVLKDRFTDRETMQSQLESTMVDLRESSDVDPTQRLVLTTFLTALHGFVGAVDPAMILGKGKPANPAKIEAVEVTQDQDQPRSSFEVMFPSAVLWGVLGCAAGFAISLVQERTGGTLLRLRVAPISRSQILAGKGLACFCACCAVILLLLVFGRLAFGVRLTNLPMLILAIVCTSCCFVGLMMFISVLGKTEQSVAGSGWAIMVVMAMLGGGMIPLVFMPPWLFKLSHVSPVKWGILSLEGAIWRGFSLTEMLLPCAVLLGIGGVFFGIGVAVLSRAET